MPTKNQPDNRGRAAGRTRSPRRGSAAPSPARPVEDWILGDERMTGAQASHLSTLAAAAGEEFDGSLTKAQASERIEELRRLAGSGRGR